MAAAAYYLGSDLDDDQSEASEISEEFAEPAGQSSGDGAVSGSEDGRSGSEANAADHSLDGDAEAGVTAADSAREGGIAGACWLDSTCCALLGEHITWHAASACAFPHRPPTLLLDVQMAAEGRQRSRSARSGPQERAQQLQRRLQRRRAAPQTTLAQRFFR